MYALPIVIIKYKTTVDANCLVKNIRNNTMYIYDNQGYLKQSNPRGLICRNEKDKTIFLKNRPYNSRLMGGVTAVMIADKGLNGDTTITSIAYHDSLGTMWFLFALIMGIYGFIDGVNPILCCGIIAFAFFMNSWDKKELIRQKELIEKTIKDCENNKLTTT